MIGNRTLSRAARERSKGNVKRAGRDRDLINPILTKREHKKINGSFHPQSHRANGLSEGWKTAVLPASFDAAGV
jgi:hypothetical protein